MKQYRLCCLCLVLRQCLRQPLSGGHGHDVVLSGGTLLKSTPDKTMSCDPGIGINVS
jgi:hypothetical protein